MLRQIFRRRLTAALLMLLLCPDVLYSQAGATITPNPDYIFNIPQNYGSRAFKGVNLFSGDVIDRFPLITINSSLLKYDLAMQYNSRSISVAALVTDNEVGGLGWKLCDYPKVAYEESSASYWLLMPDRKYQLSTISTTTASVSMKAGEDFHMWNISCTNTSDIGSRKWTLTSDDGTTYLLTQPPVSVTEGGLTAQVWNLSEMRDAQLRDSLLFTYSGRRLTRIVTPDDQDIKLVYNSNGGTLSYVLQENIKNDSAAFAGMKVNIGYGNFPGSTTLRIVNAIQTQFNPLDENTAPGNFPVRTPALRFVYQDNLYSNNGALSAVRSPDGAVTTYAYAQVGIGSGHYWPVTSLEIQPGTTYSYEGVNMDTKASFTIRYEGLNLSADAIYSYYNEAQVLPGLNNVNTVYASSSTSFEGSPDPVFGTITNGNSSTDYALSGSRSLKMYDSDRSSVKSLELTLNKANRVAAGADASSLNYKGTKDSLSINFYCFDSHSFDNLTFKIKANFYGKQHANLGSPEQEFVIDEHSYGNWVPCSVRFAIPEDALSFDFSFVGENHNTSDVFYVDNLSLDGAQYELQGSAVYHFFTGMQGNTLLHLPNAYSLNVNEEKIVGQYSTGFELGDRYHDWIMHAAAAVSNTGSKMVANNGSYGYRMSTGVDAFGIPHTLVIPLKTPAGSDRFTLSFNYSPPQMQSLPFRIYVRRLGAISTILDSVTVANTGSYFTSERFSFFQRTVMLPVANDSIVITIAVLGGTTHNDFFIDDLSVDFLAQHDPNPMLTSMIDVTDPLLLGNCYHIRVLSSTQKELESIQLVYAPANPAPAPRYLQLVSTIKKGDEENQVSFTESGRVKKILSGWDRTRQDSSSVRVLNKTEIVYADQLWPELDDSHLHLLDQAALQIDYIKKNEGASWSSSAGHLVQWKKFTQLSPVNGGKSELWSPWRYFTLIAPVSTSDVNALLQQIRNSSYTPPASQWQLDETVQEIDGMGHVLETMGHGDVVQSIQMSQHTVSDYSGKPLRRARQPIAQFTGASAERNAFYTGFEVYEKSRLAAGSAGYSNVNANTGKRSAITPTKMNLPLKQSTSTEYLVGFYAIPGSSIKVTVTDSASGRTLLSWLVTSPASGYWQYFEKKFVVPDTVCTLRFAIDNGNSGSCGPIDDFRFLPVKAVFSANVFDVKNYADLASIDDNAVVKRLLSEAGGNTQVLVDGTVQPLQLSMTYQSRMNPAQQDVFAALNPNSNTTIAARGGGTVFNWGEAAYRNQWTASYDVTYSPQTITLNCSAQNASSLILKSSALPAVRNDWGLSLQLATAVNAGVQSNAPQDLVIDFGGIAVRLRYINNATGCLVSIRTNNTWTQVATTPASIKEGHVLQNDVQAFFAGNHFLLWVDGRLIPNSAAINSSTVSKVVIAVDDGPLLGPVQISNLVFVNDPLISISFTDGTGHVMQEQYVKGNDLIVRETICDAMLRPAIVSKPALLAGQAPGYSADFVTSFNWNTGEIKGLVTHGADYIEDGTDDKNFAYARTVYQKEPDENPALQFKPGKDFALRDKTNFEKAEVWMYADLPQYIGDAIRVAGYAFDAVSVIVDPASAPRIIATDVGGALLSQVHLSHQNRQAENPVTSVVYDSHKRPQSVALPMANLKQQPQKKQVINYTYDFSSRMLSEKYPESGTSKYVYDQWGNLRFVQTEDNKTAGTIQYFKYDRFDRLVENGYWSSAFDRSSLDAHANDPAYPGGSAAVVTHNYYYDGDNSDSAGYSGRRGLLTSRRTYAADRGFSDEYLWYDQLGNVTGIRTKLTTAAGQLSVYGVSYRYDLMGNITSTAYPAYNQQSFIVTQTYDKMNNPVSVGTPSGANEYATYYWNPDGTVAGITLLGSGKKFATTMGYNAPGWTTTVSQTDSSNAQRRAVSNNDYDYNMITSAWASLWGQKYYTGKVAQSTYDYYDQSNLYVPNERGYNYDSLGRISKSYNQLPSHVEVNDGGTDNYPWLATYDVNGNMVERRKVAEHPNDQGFVNQEQSDYLFSADENRLTQINTYRAHTKSGVSGVNYRHDTCYVRYSGGGNCISIRKRFHNSDAAQADTSLCLLNYTAGGLLASASWAGTARGSGNFRVLYDGQGDRLQKISTSGNATITTTYIRGNSSSPLLEVVDSSGTVTYNYYVQGPDGMIDLVRKTGSTTKSWLVLKDRIGSVQQLINRATGVCEQKYAYDDYGNVSKTTGLNFAYRHTGHAYDNETGEYYYAARMYDPYLHQFLNPDPEHQDFGTPYAFNANDPVNRVDPDGRRNTDFLVDAIVNATEDQVVAARLEFEGMSLRDMLLDDRRYDRNGNLVRGKKRNSGDRSLSWKIEYRRRLNSRSAAVVQELRDIRNNLGVRQNENAWKAFQSVMRPGGNHEFFQISNTADWLERGLMLDDIQGLSAPTRRTFFSALDPDDAPTPINRFMHGNAGSPKAHDDVADFLINNGRVVNGGDPADLRQGRMEMYQLAQEWIDAIPVAAGEPHGYRFKYTFHPDSKALFRDNILVFR